MVGVTTRKPGRSSSRLPTLEEAPVTLVAEQPGCLLERHPACVVDLIRWSEGARGRGHLPVADGFGSSLRITVGTGPDLTAQPAPQPRLLLDLAQRRLRLGLARVELALGERPVVIDRPVDQDNLHPAARATAPDDPAAGPDDRLGHDRPPRWIEPASQALGHRALRHSRGRARRGVRGEGGRRQPGPLHRRCSRLTGRCFTIRTAQSIAIPSPWLTILELPPATRC